MEGFDQHVLKAYAYFAPGFAVLVKFSNIRVRRQAFNHPVEYEDTRAREPSNL